MQYAVCRGHGACLQGPGPGAREYGQGAINTQSHTRGADMTNQEKITVKAYWQVASHAAITGATYSQALRYIAYLKRYGAWNVFRKPVFKHLSTY